MNIFKPRERVECVERARQYARRDVPGTGFTFLVDEQEQPILANEAAQDNWQKCHDGTYDVVDLGVGVHRWHYVEPAIGFCEVCGGEVELVSAIANTCVCGAEYNLSGQRLAPREQWEEVIAASA